MPDPSALPKPSVFTGSHPDELECVNVEMAQLLSPYGESVDDYVKRAVMYSGSSELPLPYNAVDASEYKAKLDSLRAQYTNASAGLEAALTDESYLYPRLTQELLSYMALTVGHTPLPREWAQEDRMLNTARARIAQERTKLHQAEMDLLRFMAREVNFIETDVFRSRMGSLLKRRLEILLDKRLRMLAHHEANTVRWYKEGDSNENAKPSPPAPNTTTIPKENDPMAEDMNGTPSAPGRTPSA